MKICRVCEEEKDIHEFYSHPGMSGGFDSKCKECTKIRVRANRAKNSQYYKDYDKSRADDPYRAASREVYALSDAGLASGRKAKKKWEINNKKKKYAITTVGNAVRDKRLKKGVCEVCSNAKVHGHHDDYSKPLEVRWLCSAHHNQWHKENGPGKNG